MTPTVGIGSLYVHLRAFEGGLVRAYLQPHRKKTSLYVTKRTRESSLKCLFRFFLLLFVLRSLSAACKGRPKYRARDLQQRYNGGHTRASRRAHGRRKKTDTVLEDSSWQAITPNKRKFKSKERIGGRV